MFVKQAAIKFRGITWTLPRPARHHHILHVMRDVLGDQAIPGPEEVRPIQGFLANTGAFLTREQAADVVRRGSRTQLRRTRLYAVGDGAGFETNPLFGRELYSEDLW